MLKKMLKIIVVFILAIILIFAIVQRFRFQIKQHYNNAKILNNKSEYKIICFGESVTVGQYPNHLQRLLDERYPNRFSVIDCGIQGAGIETILYFLDTNIKRYHPDIAICMVGAENGFVSINKKNNSETITQKINENCGNIFKLFVDIKRYLIDFFTNGNEKNNLNIVTDNIQNDFNFVKINPFNLLCIRKNSFCEYFKLEYNLSLEGRYSQAVAVLRDILDKDPGNQDAYFYLAMNLMYNLNDELGYKMATYAVDNVFAFEFLEKYHISLFHYLSNNNKSVEYAKQKLFGSTKYVPTLNIYKKLAPFLSDTEKKSLEKSIRLDKNEEKAIYYIERKEYDKAKEYFDKSEELRLLFPNVNTYNLYKLLVKTLIDNNIEVICMQYPMRSIAPLKAAFKDEPYYDKIKFVSNENFKQALINKGYDSLFVDQYGGDLFGHCTELGNIMISENIIETLKTMVD